MEAPDQVAIRQAKELRLRHRLSQQRLAERLSALGSEFTQAAVARLETGRTRNLPVADLFAFAAALDVAPVQLLAGSFDQSDVPVIGGLSLSPRHCRDWIRGRRPLPDSDRDAYYQQTSDEEQRIYRLLPSLFLLYAWISDLEEATLAGNLAYAEHALQVIKEQVSRLRRDLELNQTLWQQKASIAHAKHQHRPGHKH